MSSTGFIWSRDKVEHLCQLLSEATCLWNKTDSNYKKKNPRYNALNHISSALDLSVREVDRKIRNLIGQFAREKKKMKIKIGLGADQKYTSKWFAFPLLLFLDDINVLQPTINSVTEVINESSSNKQEVTNTENVLILEEPDEFIIETDISPANIDNKKRRFDKKKEMNDKFLKVAKSLVNCYKNKNNEDTDEECKKFGEFVAAKMRKFTPYKRALFQADATKLLLKHEFNEF